MSEFSGNGRMEKKKKEEGLSKRESVFHYDSCTFNGDRVIQKNII